ncbi:hypothetical protein [Streptomyces sp. NPDC059092]|uniref:hypothetical protein n=1 Tax=Streptomyces sp. NPDC059092 TaxID=3346725 RepID=UPI0036C061B8
MPRARLLRTATITAATTGSALAVVLLPLVVGALASRAVGGDPMASVNAMITSGGQRARLSRSQLRTCRGGALTSARYAWGQSARWTNGKPLRSTLAGARHRIGRERPAPPRHETRSVAERS